jgi:predicted P-loop ATPase
MEPLRDKTGGRRFWPVSVSKGRLEPWNDLNADQIWAEAVQSFKNGEQLFLPPHLEEIAKKLQAEFTEESDKAGIVYEYLDTLLPENWDELDLGARRLYLSGDFTGGEGKVKRNKVCALEVWCECFGGDPKQLSNAQSREIRSILDNADGWKRAPGKNRFKLFGIQRAYVRS